MVTGVTGVTGANSAFSSMSSHIPVHNLGLRIHE
jgi:hypothetical protein